MTVMGFVTTLNCSSFRSKEMIARPRTPAIRPGRLSQWIRPFSTGTSIGCLSSWYLQSETLAMDSVIII
ncbi:hypothetical protein L2E82_25511 [Cichorium intybus]|uniref:Uncharacterized protein n=1 Tax=Cichorium intybus TaxID=13427 RepID=A0ACB9E388_CICIN|nr:hypothetical protein L2E82_25511 [Cichorium intybus]